MKVNNTLATLMATGIIGSDFLDPITNRFKRTVKLCLMCFTEHKHNNSFCSAECCKSYKEKQNDNY